MPSRTTFSVFCLLFAGLLLCSRANPQVYFTTTKANWKYIKGRSEASLPGTTAWRARTFDDSSWAGGPAPFYYSTAATEPPFYFGGTLSGTGLSDMMNDYTTVFFRKTFVVSNAAGLTSLTLQFAIDDGCIIWLNGVELARTNVAAGSHAYTGVALTSVSEPVPVRTLEIPNTGLLLEGTNVLAVHGLNQSAGSSDFGFMAGLSAVDSNALPPSITSQPQDQFVSASGGTTFQVQASGTPPLRYHDFLPAILAPTPQTAHS